MTTTRPVDTSPEAVARALVALTGIARDQRTRPNTSSLRAQSYAIDDAIRTFEAAYQAVRDLLPPEDDRECTCTPIAAGGDGPEVDCDVHGLPSAAYLAGRDEGITQARAEATTLGTIGGVAVVLPDDAIAHRELSLLDDTTDRPDRKSPRDLELARIVLGMHTPNDPASTVHRIAQIRADARGNGPTSPRTAEQASPDLVAPEASGQGVKVRTDARDTSRAAALAALPQAGRNRRKVLDTIADAGHLPPFEGEGLTDLEIARHTQMPENSVRPRRVELVEGGWIEDSGRRRKHDGHRTAHAVWVLTTKGRAQYGR